ncbi:MAG TPA: translation initiation factor IF-2 [Candidatus Methylomirabilis sp.]|nr:translation initiation factor IF-2 [Candidatus Methylomirabilis sp.]
MVRIYDLATKFRLTTKEVLERLQAAGIEAATFGSSVDEARAAEVLSQPVARIPVRTIRPGTGVAMKPATRRPTRAKSTATPAAGTAAAAPKRRSPAKPAVEDEAKEAAKPRAPRKRVAARSEPKPLVVTLQAPTVEAAMATAAPAELAPSPPPSPPVEPPKLERPSLEVAATEALPTEALPAETVTAEAAPPEAVPVEPPKPVIPKAEPVSLEPVRPEVPAQEPPTPPAPPKVETPSPIRPPMVGRPVEPAPPPRPAPPEPPRTEPRRPPSRPIQRPAPPRPSAPVETPALGAPRAKPPARPEGKPHHRPEPPRPAVQPPRPMVAGARAPDLGALEAPAAAAFVPPPEPVFAPPAAEPKVPTRQVPPVVEARPEPAPPTVKVLKVGEGMSPKELAEKMSATASDVIKRLIKLGILATINTVIDAETVSKVAQQFGYSVERATPEEMMEETVEVEDPALLRPRAPVVTVMGHVDHGKTSLLDAIRHTDVIATEAGGITQHMGAYEVEVPGHAVDRVVFLDTPGHEAFTAMRARGAQATDIVVLVVAADDGVMPQTIEAINHAKDAKVPILVAINKIDKPSADPNRVKQQLTEYGLVAEEWGGDTIFVPVSAKRREGIENLLDNLLVLAEIQELKANPSKPARGVVVEAELDKGRGPVATVLVQSGTLRVGDAMVAGMHYGKVRAMLNGKGRKLQEAGPATPVEILGLSGVPLAGDTFAMVGDDRKARQIAMARQEKQRQEVMVSQPRVTLAELHQQIERGEVKELRMILKGDVQGSVEPLHDSLQRLGTEQVKVNIIHSSVGAITESDVMLASASNAIIVGFNVRPEPKAQKLAEQERVDLQLYTVIYEAINQIKAAMQGLLEPLHVERPVGRVEVRQVFTISKVGTVAGSYVADGKVVRDASVRLVRDGRVIHTGKIASLRRFKDDVREVLSGQECGIGLVNYNDVHQGDVLEVFEVQEIAPKL